MYFGYLRITAPAGWSICALGYHYYSYLLDAVDETLLKCRV